MRRPLRTPNRPQRFLWLLAALLAAYGCSQAVSPTPPIAPPAPASPLAPTKVEAVNLHNVHRLTENLYSGSSPEGDAGFESLQKLGIKTIISVDGARPDLDRAGKHGLRYVHLPIGYDGVPERQALRIARAIRDLPGPVYLHCHHGKHRGPAAAAVAVLCLDDKCGVEAAVQWMRQAGTDPHYTGLYAAPKQLRRPTTAELDRIPADFPEVAEVTALAQVMVEIDEHWTRLSQVRAAGWKQPPEHPDVDPPHEALQLAEQYREATRLRQVKDQPEELRRWMADAEAAVKELEAVLRKVKEKGPVDVTEGRRLDCGWKTVQPGRFRAGTCSLGGVRRRKPLCRSISTHK